MNENKVMRILRETNGYTQEYIASELGINQNTYSKLEAGQTRLTVERVRKLAEIYKVDPDYFFSKDVSVINYNTGEHSHGGPIHTYNSCDSTVKKLYEQILYEKEEKLKLLQSELEHKRQEIEKLVSLVEKLSNKI